MAGRLEERMDQRNEAADMMQDRCNGFSGQALHHLNASEACWPAFTQPVNRLAGGFVSRSFECGVGWAKEGDAIGGVYRICFAPYHLQRWQQTWQQMKRVFSTPTRAGSRMNWRLECRWQV
jgi:hypothetical protein